MSRRWGNWQEIWHSHICIISICCLYPLLSRSHRPLVGEGMGSCSDEEFWDRLLRRCAKCTNCGHNWKSACKTYCESWSCNEAAGFYWDKLLRKCIKCSDVCGQHPQQCSEVCYDTKADTQNTLRHCLSHEDHSNILLFAILAASVCVVTCIFLMLLACCIKRWVPSTCSTESIHKTNTSSKDGLLQPSVEGDDHNQSISSNPSLSEPSETCSYCFSDQRISDKEQKVSNTATHQCIQVLSANNTRVPPSATVYKEKPFQIICSPSQPSIKETPSFQEKCHMKY
ncbi:tumor necrosis factor receptor superfamily member 13B isoform X2 [Stegostoma tigrinum]|uniref:tumor necrosis factor receptor superfamily member 13B isoform X2 n=1 Tax=Stegostoma tigrinum TaxID=3053191 RepID=UPI00202B878B|nr:tumor necrosis factor receptor superfamily member 13B isoform X2 [Stegostoma tigrinum]